MATSTNTPLTSEIWHLSIDDLLEPIPESPRLGGTGPFVINLSASTAPISQPIKSIADHPSAHVYQIQRTEDRRLRYRLRLGPFDTEDQADALLTKVRDIYPSALTATAEIDDLRAIETLKAKAEAQQLAAAKAVAKAAPTTLSVERVAARAEAPPPLAVVEPSPPPKAVTPNAAPNPAPVQELASTPPPAWLALLASNPPAPSVRQLAPSDLARRTRPAFDPASIPVLSDSVEVVRRPAAKPVAVPSPLPTPKPAPTESAVPVASSPVAAPEPAPSKVLAEVAVPVRVVAAAVAPMDVVPVVTATAHVVPVPAVTMLADAVVAVVPAAAAVPVAVAPPTVAPVTALDTAPAAVAAAAAAAPVEVAAVAQPVAASPSAAPVPHVAPLAAPAVAPPMTAAPAAKVGGPKTNPPSMAAAPIVAAPLAVPKATMPPSIPSPEVAAPKIAASSWAATPIPKAAAKPMVSAAPKPSSHVAAPSEPLQRRVEALGTRLPNLESTQTLRPLTPLEVQDAAALRWFVIQLSMSEESFDPDSLPNLDIFNEYRLYSVAAFDQGKVTHALRLGFFAEESGAAAVASYLSAFYEKPVVKRVSVAERQRFADQRVEARKDIGATGRHAVIEITNERVIREKRTTTAILTAMATPPTFAQQAAARKGK